MTGFCALGTYLVPNLYMYLQPWLTRYKITIERDPDPGEYVSTMGG